MIQDTGISNLLAISADADESNRFMYNYFIVNLTAAERRGIPTFIHNRVSITVLTVKI